MRISTQNNEEPDEFLLMRLKRILTSVSEVNSGYKPEVNLSYNLTFCPPSKIR